MKCFSLSWSRILPEGTGEVNQKGIDYYNHLIDCLKAHNIEPFVTLYHWDLPQALQEKGGWLNPDSVQWFGDYTKIVAEAFSDRVKYFITFNEPQCFIGLGYYGTVHAPGLNCSPREAFDRIRTYRKVYLSKNQQQRGYSGCQGYDVP